MDSKILMWVVFNIVVAGLLYIDLRMFNRKAHVVSLKEAALWSLVWFLTAMVFNAGIYFFMGSQRAMEFLTGYVIEKSLSVDNMFVFIMIFSYFAIPPLYQARILHWGILGALVMRFILILAGVALIQTFHWVIYLFGVLLIVSGIKMGLQKDQEIHPDKNPVLRAFKRLMPVSNDFVGESFFFKKEGVWHATPLFATLLVVEFSDLVFAIDSIPAVLAITTDTFIVYTSNVFAILGLRALYFLLAGIMGMFRYLKVGISLILCYVGMKMILVDHYKIPTMVSLSVVLGILALSILASMAIRETPAATPPGKAPSDA